MFDYRAGKRFLKCNLKCIREIVYSIERGINLKIEKRKIRNKKVIRKVFRLSLILFKQYRKKMLRILYQIKLMLVIKIDILILNYKRTIWKIRYHK